MLQTPLFRTLGPRARPHPRAPMASFEVGLQQLVEPHALQWPLSLSLALSPLVPLADFVNPIPQKKPSQTMTLKTLSLSLSLSLSLARASELNPPTLRSIVTLPSLSVLQNFGSSMRCKSRGLNFQPPGPLLKSWFNSPPDAAWPRSHGDAEFECITKTMVTMRIQ